MSKHVQFRQHSKLRADHTIQASFALFSKRPSAHSGLKRLLHTVWLRSDLLKIDSHSSTYESILALRNLARYAHRFVRYPATWPGCRGSSRTVIASLANHVLGAYPVPEFLASVWFGSHSIESRRKREWYIAHAKGNSFRSLDLPFSMTRRMEHIFLGSPANLTLEHAMRRSELLSLGASPELTKAVLATHLGEDLSHGTFWRTVMAFFVKAGDLLSLSQVGPIIDFLHSLRIKRVAMPGYNGPILIEPIEPEFSVKGRTLASVMRLVDCWHKTLGQLRIGGNAWMPSTNSPMRMQERPKTKDSPALFWEVIELTNSQELQVEGRALRHCVASYAQRCIAGRSRIWSLRTRSDLKSCRSVLTIEVCPRRGAIVQAKGMSNRAPSGRPLELLETWARRENLSLSF